MRARLGIGPANYAGQADQWAAAMRRCTEYDAYSFSHRARPFGVVGAPPPLSFHADVLLPHPRTMTRLGRHLRRRALGRSSTHLMLDGFVPVGEPLASGLDRDLEYLSDHGIRLALVSHGSDIRHPEEHRDWFVNSYFKYADPSWVSTMRRQVERNQQTVARFPSLPIFASTPDQLIHQPRATWLPLTLDLSHLPAPDRDPLLRSRPAVLHVPSRRKPPIKGSQFIDPVMRALQEEGLIDYIAPYSVPHTQLLNLVASVDIVVDQILTGSYGLAAVEGMALGRIVIGNVDARVRTLMPENPPILDAAPDTFEQVMREILAMPEAFRNFGPRGRAFVARWHSGKAAAERILHWMGGTSAYTRSGTLPGTGGPFGAALAGGDPVVLPSTDG